MSFQSKEEYNYKARANIDNSNTAIAFILYYSKYMTIYTLR